MDEENIIRLFIKAAHQHGNRVAFIEKEEKASYEQLLEKVKITASYFLKNEINKSDKVLVFVPVSVQLYVVVLALLYIGAVPVFLDEWVSLKRLKACLQTVPCKAIVGPRKVRLLSCLISPLRKLKKLSPVPSSGLLPMPLPTQTKRSDTALVTFTTGSTGTPKAANRTHQFLAAQYSALHPLLDNAYTVSLTLLPIVVLLNLCLGKTNVLPGKKLQLQKESTAHFLLQLIKQQKVEMLVASPAITVAIANVMKQHNYVPNVIKQIITGGGPVFPDGATTIVGAFPNADSLVVYGSTEAEPVSTISMQALAATSKEILLQKGLPVGDLHQAASVVIIPFTRAVIPNLTDKEFLQMQVPAGASGELLVSGPHVLQTYLNNEAAQKQNKFFVGNTLWHRTGDKALLDEEHRLYFFGRCNEVIMWKGKKIYPLLATWQLKQQVPVKEAALLLLNNKMLLVLEKADKMLLKQVAQYLVDTDLHSAIICFVKKIPKDKRHQTKIDYEKLKALLS